MRHTAGQDSHRGLGIGLGCDLSAADALVNCLMGRAGEVVDDSIYSWDLVVEWVDSQTIRITNGLLWCNDPSKHRANHSPDGVDFASFSDLFTNLPWVGRGVCNGIWQAGYMAAPKYGMGDGSIYIGDTMLIGNLKARDTVPRAERFGAVYAHEMLVGGASCMVGCGTVFQHGPGIGMWLGNTQLLPFESPSTRNTLQTLILAMTRTTAASGMRVQDAEEAQMGESRSPTGSQQTAQACGRLWKLLETLNVSKHGPYEAWNKAVSRWDMWQNDIRPFSRQFYSPTVNKFKTLFDDGSH